MANDTLEDSSCLGHVGPLEPRGLPLFCMSAVSDDSPPKEKVFNCFLATPSFHLAALNILLLSAITGPKFPFYKDVSPLLIKWNSAFILESVYVCARVSLTVNESTVFLSGSVAPVW